MERIKDIKDDTTRGECFILVFSDGNSPILNFVLEFSDQDLKSQRCVVIHVYVRAFE